MAKFWICDFKKTACVVCLMQSTIKRRASHHPSQVPESSWSELVLANSQKSINNTMCKYFCKNLGTIFFMILFSACGNVGISTEITDPIQNTPGNSFELTKTTPETPALSMGLHPILAGKEDLLLVVDAIELYFIDNSTYPSIVEDLVPDYLDLLPYTRDGHEIWYEIDPDSIYRVGYYPTETRYCIYEKSEDYIECGIYTER